jgi:hypothetical protein
MKTRHVLEPYKPEPERDWFPILDVILAQFDDLCERLVPGVLDVGEADGRLVDEDFENFGTSGGVFRVEDECAHTNGLVELCQMHGCPGQRRRRY